MLANDCFLKMEVWRALCWSLVLCFCVSQYSVQGNCVLLMMCATHATKTARHTLITVTYGLLPYSQHEVTSVFNRLSGQP